MYVIQTGLRYVFSAVTLKNNEAMEELLQSSIELALGNVRTSLILTHMITVSFLVRCPLISGVMYVS